MGLTAAEVEERQENRSEGSEKILGSKRLLENPRKAVEEMRESDEYEGVAFDKSEVTEYIAKKISEGNRKASRNEEPGEYDEVTGPPLEASDTLDYMVGQVAEEDPDDVGTPMTSEIMGKYIHGALSDDEGVEIIGQDGKDYFKAKDEVPSMEGMIDSEESEDYEE